nr:ribonuclease domain-containing protein [Paraconexibacter algicola]
MSRTSLRTVLGLVLTLTVIVVAAVSGGDGRRTTTTTTEYAVLPPEATAVLRAIRSGGPFRYRQDGSVFANREGLLPERPRGYYREYTVPTPGSPDRGARRIVTGGDPPEVSYYSRDHYDSFAPIASQQLP